MINNLSKPKECSSSSDTVKGQLQKSSLLGLGLIALESHELNSARDYFENARKIDPEYMAAITDLGFSFVFQR